MRILILLLLLIVGLVNSQAQNSEPKLKITPLTGDFYIYTMKTARSRPTECTS